MKTTQVRISKQDNQPLPLAFGRGSKTDREVENFVVENWDEADWRLLV